MLPRLGADLFDGDFDQQGGRQFGGGGWSVILPGFASGEVTLDHPVIDGALAVFVFHFASAPEANGAAVIEGMIHGRFRVDQAIEQRHSNRERRAGCGQVERAAGAGAVNIKKIGLGAIEVVAEWDGKRLAVFGEGQVRHAPDFENGRRLFGNTAFGVQGLDEAGRVIYTGSFSKTLFPGLRLGYLVAPEGLVGTFLHARALANRSCAGLEQFLAAEFLSEGHFGRHVRRMRALYAERQQTLVAAVERELAGALEVHASDAGQHLVAWLPAGSNDAAISQRAAAAGIVAPPLSAYSIESRVRPGLLLGYAAYNPRQIREGVRKLAAVLEKAL